MKRPTSILLLVPVLWACNAEIGDDCTYDVDCSPNRDRYCDGSQPDGYCLVIGCGPNECPEEASCVNFITPCPTGQGYEDGDKDTDEDSDKEIDKCSLIESNRGRTYCMKHCSSNGDCRDEYQCLGVTELSAEIIDYYGSKSKICVPK